MEVDYYYLLGIEENASPKEIKVAYRKMAEIYHPDKLRELPENSRKEGEEIMRLLNEAKSILMDPERKARYDERIGAGIQLEEALVVEGPSESHDPSYMVAIEKETMAKKMARVLGSMKITFGKDRDFQNKIAIAEEMVEAQIIEDSPSQPPVKKGEDPLSDEDEVEMKLRFTVVEGEEGIGPGKRDPPGKKRFKILAIEGDEGSVSSEDEVDVEWE